MNKILEIISKILDIILQRSKTSKLEEQLAHEKWRAELQDKINKADKPKEGINFDNPYEI